MSETAPETQEHTPGLRRDAEDETQRRRFAGRWGVLHGLQKKPFYNGKMAMVGVQRADGRFETARPGSRSDGSRDELAVRPENLRLLLEEYGGFAAGDEVDFAGGEVVLLGFDRETDYWACTQDVSGSGQCQYVWIPEQLVRG